MNPLVAPIISVCLMLAGVFGWAAFWRAVDCDS